MKSQHEWELQVVRSRLKAFTVFFHKLIVFFPNMRSWNKKDLQIRYVFNEVLNIPSDDC